MIDINDFKSINDRFGHKCGDEALQYTAAILTDTFGKDAFISRYGGDEFVVIIETYDEKELEKAVSLLRKNINEFNTKSKNKYELTVSIGYDSCPVDDLSMFIEHIDSLMYTHKQNTKPEKP
jgi:diguanylate cyclase (GGDEF)-like protein